MRYMVYVDQYDADGALENQELVSTHSMWQEALRTLQNMKRTIAEAGNDKTHTVVIVMAPGAR